MNLDGLTLTNFTHELNTKILDSQIKSFVQIDKHTLVFKLAKQKDNYNFVVTVGSNPACYLAHNLKDLPKEASSLCMFLRKHLEGGRLTKIEQLNGDRILCLSIDKLSLAGELINTQVYIELIGKYSNCIFVQDGIILESLIHVTPLMSQERVIGPKQVYELPPNANRVSLFDFTEQEIYELLKNYVQETITLTIRNVFNGIGPKSLKEICHRAELKEKDSFSERSETELQDLCKRLANALIQVKNEIIVNHQYYKYQTSPNKFFYSPIQLTYPDQNRESVEILDELSPEIEADIEKTGSINTVGQELTKLINHALNKEELRNSKIKEELADTSKSEENKLLGDLLMINAYLPVTYDDTITLSNILVTPAEDIVVPIRPGLSMSENAQLYYKQYTKLKNRMISGQYQLDQSNTRLEYLNSIQYSLTLANDRQAVQEIRQECEEAGLIKKSKKNLHIKNGKENYIHFILPEGEVYIGKNNQQNEYLTHKFAKAQDIWFHTLNIQGSHLIFRPSIPIEALDDELYVKLASYAAYYSKAQNSSKVPVDYTLKRYIKKPPASPLGFVIYTNQKTLYVDPVEPKI